MVDHYPTLHKQSDVQVSKKTQKKVVWRMTEKVTNIFGQINDSDIKKWCFVLKESISGYFSIEEKIPWFETVFKLLLHRDNYMRIKQIQKPDKNK